MKIYKSVVRLKLVRTITRLVAMSSLQEKVFSNATYHQDWFWTEPSEYSDVGCLMSSNFTSPEDIVENSYSDGQVAFVTVILPIVMALGVLNNSAFIYVVARVPRMRTVTNCYLVGLAIADILFLVFAIGSKIWCYIYSPIYTDDTPLGLSGCLLTQFIINMSYFATLCFITLVSWERYNGVCRPHRKRDTKLTVFTLVVISTLVSSLISASLLMSFSKVYIECIIWPDRYPYNEWPRVRYLFYPMYEWSERYSYGVQTIPFFCSLVTNAIFYHQIIRGLDKSMNRSHHSNHRIHTRDSSTRNQIARMLVINGVALFALLAPFEIMSLFHLVGMLRGDQFLLPQEVRIYLVAVARVTSYFNAIVNPVIYTALSSTYRESFRISFFPAQCRPSQRQRIENSVRGSTVTVQCGISSRTQESRM